jgi:hypothetical protein
MTSSIIRSIESSINSAIDGKNKVAVAITTVSSLRKMDPKKRMKILSQFPEVAALLTEKGELETTIADLQTNVVELQAGFEFVRQNFMGKKATPQALAELQAKASVQAAKDTETALAAIDRAEISSIGSAAMAKLFQPDALTSFVEVKKSKKKPAKAD